MEIIADLHTHTLASTHAFNTVTEMARAAYEMGHKAIAITDHGPQMPDSPHIWHFYNLMRLPQKIEGVFLLRGMEADVLNIRGELDFRRQSLSGCSRIGLSLPSIPIHCNRGNIRKKISTSFG